MFPSYTGSCWTGAGVAHSEAYRGLMGVKKGEGLRLVLW